MQTCSQNINFRLDALELNGNVADQLDIKIKNLNITQKSIIDSITANTTFVQPQLEPVNSSPSQSGSNSAVLGICQTLRQQLDGLTKVFGTSGSSSDFGTRFSVIESNVTQLTSSVGEVKSGLTSLNSSYTDLKSKLDAIQEGPCALEPQIMTQNEVPECEGDIFAQRNNSLFIMSRDYPNLYRNNELCTWVIKAPRGWKVQIEFVDFRVNLTNLFSYKKIDNSYNLQTESHDNCNYDYVELFDGPSVSSPSLRKFCGSTRPGNGAEFRSSSNHLTVKFRSDGSEQFKGFKASTLAVCND